MKAHRRVVVVAGNSLVPIAKALTRWCPKCGAGPGKRCFRMVGRNSRVGYPGYQVPNVKPHSER